jgi:NAD-dependent dihydropyrimidine dehydrogenase PreA subunit
MPLLASHDMCTGCLICIDSCKFNALTYKYESDGFFFPKVDVEKCTECKVCEKSCPIINGYSYESIDEYKPIPYAAWSVNDEFRMNSSSGGVFPELAKVVLDDNGIVIGATIDGLFIKHVSIDSISDLHLLQGSKYMQSDTTGIYNTSYEYLKKGKTVLFSGTPCQVGALLSFLEKKKYKGKLYTVNVICYGVPSRLPIDIYNKSISEKLKGISAFRNKKDSWLTSVKPEHCITYKADNVIDEESVEAGTFQMGTFLQHLTLRMCCYDCKFAHFERKCDISVADFWEGIGYNEEHKKGISLLATNTLTGESLLNRSRLIKHKITWGKAGIWYNCRFFSGINSLKNHPARQMMPLLMNILPVNNLKQIYALHNCESKECEQYKNQHKMYETENYQNNKQKYFKLMLKKVKFVNIISFQMAYNYGSVLQSYALKQTIERLGYDVRFINMKPSCFEFMAFNWKYPDAKSVKISFDNFRKRNFPYSLDLYNQEKEIIEFNDLDIFIVGSDQVWNTRYSGEYWKEYFLNFVPNENKKIAYAASFGEDISSNILDEVQTYLKRFDMISCREKQGTEYCKVQFNINSVRVLDPTLLNVDYSKIFNPEKYIRTKEELVFTSVSANKHLYYKYIEYIGGILNFNVRVINSKPEENSFLYSHYVSVEEWLSLLYNSSYVVTNSFHTMVFAILFKKPFMILSFSMIEENIYDTTRSRFESLLSDLGLEDRYFSSFEEIKSDHRWINPIDYKQVYRKLEPIREFSLNFLKQALEK